MPTSNNGLRRTRSDSAPARGATNSGVAACQDGQAHRRDHRRGQALNDTRTDQDFGPRRERTRRRGAQASVAATTSSARSPAASTVYELNDVGQGLEAVLMAIGRWGHRFMDVPRENEFLSASAYLVAMRALFQPEAEQVGS